MLQDMTYDFLVMLILSPPAVSIAWLLGVVYFIQVASLFI